VSSIRSDLINVIGGATLAGAVSVSLLGAPDFSKLYTILTSTLGRTGTFGGATTSTPLVTAALSYTATDAQLKFSPNLVPFAGNTINQNSVASALQNA